MLLQKLLGRAACAVAFVVCSCAAQASPLGSGEGSRPVVRISNNSGGTIAAFAADAAGYRDTGTLVQFTGRCDSACTLFLGLPSRQLCVSPGSYFRFHSPIGVSAGAAQMAQSYLLRKYPGWVRAWISRNHGLSHQLMTMDYDYASQYLKTCTTVATR